MTAAALPKRKIPKHVRKLKLGQRIKWARQSAHLSHDELVARIGRSNRSHLIKIEKGVHTPGGELRDAIADATNVPRGLFSDDDDEESERDLILALIRRLERQVS